MAYLGLTTPAASEWRSFGSDILGLQAIEDGADGALRFRMDEADCRLWIHPGERNDIAYIGWTLGDEGSVLEVAKAIDAAGAAVSEGSPDEAEARKVIGFHWFIDPAGFRHELSWGQYRVPNGFLPGRPMSGFKTGDQGMGHIVLMVPDLAAADAFYRGAMGFRLSDRIVDGSRELLFYHCNGRHHSLAIAAPVPGKSGAHHLMLEVNALDDVGRAVDLCALHDVPVSKSIGCHSNDRMVSSYLFSPSVLRIEYGFGGVEIDDLWETKTYAATSIWGHKELRPDLPPAMIVSR
jgi:2,3-dihydroxybiphenyl 1,2-dioxygenase